MSKEEAIRLLKESGAINWPGGPAWSIRVDDAERLVALARAPQDGWVMVPKEPTEEMIEAGWIDKEDVSPREIWWAMLAAAPSPITGEKE
jgi:hypothetical protein